MMQTNSQDQIIAKLEEKITHLKTVLEEVIEKHSDAKYDLIELKLALEGISEKNESAKEKMLVMASEWEEID